VKYCIEIGIIIVVTIFKRRNSNKVSVSFITSLFYFGCDFFIVTSYIYREREREKIQKKLYKYIFKLDFVSSFM
jgi:hypothetical protein